MTELAVAVTELVAVLQSRTNPPTPLASVVFLLFLHYKTATCHQSVLMFDEMSVRKSLHVRESDMALLGKVDLAEHTKPTDQVKDGDHVLVFLFRPFLGGWSQTVGAFCTSGAAPGSTVAKLILQCIVLLSNAGVIVEAVTCDNSTSNRSALNSLGKYLQSLFIFKLPGDKEVQHSHFEALLDYEEQQAGLRAVPKLTKAHISPNAFQKLSVRLAVQPLVCRQGASDWKGKSLKPGCGCCACCHPCKQLLRGPEGAVVACVAQLLHMRASSPNREGLRTNLHKPPELRVDSPKRVRK
ncbi:hypothetical protein HPB51_029221 [Rhipicephalus microplus]|uniref:Transposable element P transposase-like RNase H domain-containing protein n=1 Tax=Rhipicephalus microplus TaxID=6941 RepID=A0A9J6CUN3_RHIMP|nr:hypothetical protein HPB51_029221 [Rhipicephalus microplus]